MEMDQSELQAYLRYIEEKLLNDDDDVMLENAEVQLATPVPSTCTNTLPSNCNSEYHNSLNLDPPNNISCALPADQQSQIPHSSTPQNHTSPLPNPSNLLNVPVHRHSDVVTETQLQAASHPQEYFYNQNNGDHMHQNRIPYSTPQQYTITSGSSLPMPSIHQFNPQSLSNIPMNQPQPLNDQFTSEVPYNFPVYQSPPTDEFRPQVPSAVPMQMQLPMNHSSQQNITQLAPSMPTRLVHHQPYHHLSQETTMLPNFPSAPFHYNSTPQNHIVHSVPPIHQWNLQNLSNGVQYNPQLSHELQPLTSPPEFSSDPWLSNRQHLLNQPSFINSEAPINIDQANNNKGKCWSEDEHRRFLIGLLHYEKGDWKSISKIVMTRTPTQVASHAQKFYERRDGNVNQRRKRIRSVLDITDPYAFH